MRVLALVVLVACAPPVPSEGGKPRLVAEAAPSDPELAATRPPAPAESAGATSSAAASARPSFEIPRRRPRRWGQDLEGVIRQIPRGKKPRLALTFDACGGPGGDGYDAELIGLLEREQVAATLFLTARWIETHRAEAKALAENSLFDIENHGEAHKPCSVDGRAAFGIRGTRSVDAAIDEIEGGALSIASLTGRRPRFYRPGTGYFDDVCLELAKGLGAEPLGFLVNGDGGTGYGRDQVAKAIAKAPDGAIVVMHMNHPRGATAEGVAAALPALRERGVELVRLRDAFDAETR